MLQSPPCGVQRIRHWRTDGLSVGIKYSDLIRQLVHWFTARNRQFDWNHLVGVHLSGINGHTAANQNQVFPQTMVYKRVQKYLAAKENDISLSSCVFVFVRIFMFVFFVKVAHISEFYQICSCSLTRKHTDEWTAWRPQYFGKCNFTGLNSSTTVKICLLMMFKVWL